MRFANLPAGATLDLVAAAPSASRGAAGGKVKIALQVDGGERIVCECESSATLWQLLRTAEENTKQYGKGAGRRKNAGGRGGRDHCERKCVKESARCATVLVSLYFTRFLCFAHALH